MPTVLGALNRPVLFHVIYPFHLAYNTHLALQASQLASPLEILPLLPMANQWPAIMALVSELSFL